MTGMRRLGRVLNIKPTGLSGTCHDTVLWSLHDTNPKRTFRVTIIGAFAQMLATGRQTISLRQGFPIRDPLQPIQLGGITQFSQSRLYFFVRKTGLVRHPPTICPAPPGG